MGSAKYFKKCREGKLFYLWHLQPAEFRCNMLRNCVSFGAIINISKASVFLAMQFYVWSAFYALQRFD